MASITLSVPLVPPSTPSLNVDAISAAAPVALIAAEAEMLQLPAAQLLAAGAPPPAPETGQDGAAMRPDQVFLARQLAWPVADGQALAASWQALVRTYGAQLATRDQQASAGRLPAALLAAAPDARPLRQQELVPGAADAWRFTVHAGGPQAQHLSVITEEPDRPPGRRRRARAALRLELILADGAVVTVQVEPLPEGLVLELCAAGAAPLARLRALQPELEAAIGRSGLRVLRWRYRDSLPAGPVHARVPSGDAAAMFTLPVFRALAELALLLPARGDAEPADARAGQALLK